MTNSHNRQKTAKLLTDNDLMPFVKSMAQQFGDNGKLPFVSVKTENDSAWFGYNPARMHINRKF